MDFRLFCETYLSTVFNREWSDDHLEVVAQLQNAVLHGGQSAVAMPRGMGKTAMCIAACEWALLYGHRFFVVLIAASADKAADNLKKIITDFSSNELLAEDFPEVIHPIRRLEGIPHRAGGQHLNGARTHIEWKQNNLTLPTVKGSRVSGSVVRVAGLTGSIRGYQASRASDGSVIRPDLVLLDDPQTSASAQSAGQIRTRKRLIQSDVMGLAGPGQKIAVLAAVTVIASGDVADQLLDIKKHPEWKGKRIPMMRSLPTDTKLWDQYAEVMGNSWRAHGNISDATAFYLANREAMDKGGQATWDSWFDKPDEVSAIQHAMNIKIERPESFASECQNAPLSNEAETPLTIVPAHLYKKIIPLKRGIVPLNTAKLTAFIDVQQDVLYYAVCAWQNDFTGHIVDYGTCPDQRKAYFTLREVTVPYAKLLPGAAWEGQLQNALTALTAQLTREYLDESGKPHHISRIMIDAGWDDGSGIVKQFCRQSVHAGLLLPSYGRHYGVDKKPLNEYKPEAGVRSAWNWRVTQAIPKHLLFDANQWKTFSAQRLISTLGDPGTLTIFDGSETAHRMLADHIASEYPMVITGNGRTITEWHRRPNRDNHWLDCLIGCFVAASEQGIKAFGHQTAIQQTRKRRKVEVTF